MAERKLFELDCDGTPVKVFIDVEAIANQLLPRALRSWNARCSALFGAVIVQTQRKSERRPIKSKRGAR